jgi:hypothetical protein
MSVVTAVSSAAAFLLCVQGNLCAAGPQQPEEICRVRNGAKEMMAELENIRADKNWGGVARIMASRHLSIDEVSTLARLTFEAYGQGSFPRLRHFWLYGI